MGLLGPRSSRRGGLFSGSGSVVVAVVVSVFTGAVGLGCPPGASDTEGPTSATQGGEEQFPRPRILDPAGESIDVPVNSVGPLEFAVAGIIPGVTLVVIDRNIVGTLSPATALGELTEDTLRLELNGGMIQDEHSLVLVNPSSEEPEGFQISRALVLSMRVGDRPTLSATLSGTLSPGSAVTVDGTYDDALLTVVEEPPGEVAVAHIFALEGGSWAATPRSLPLPGYSRAADERSPPVTAQWASRAGEEGGEDRLRVAWRVGQDGSAIAGVELGPGGAGSGQPLTLMTAPEPFTESLEWAGYGRPRFHGGDLLVEVEALVDTELDHPGDHRLLQLRWPPPPGLPGAPFEVSVGEVMDLDAFGPAVDLNDRGRPLQALRTGGSGIGLVDRDSVGGARIVMDMKKPLPLEAGAEVDLVAIVSSLGGWMTFAIDRDGAYVLTLNDTYSILNMEPIFSAERPEAAPTGPPALAILGGTPLVAVPYGAGEDVHVASLNTEVDRLKVLGGVRCDSIALLVDDPARSEVPLVCVLDGEARLGLLSAALE